MRSWKAVFVPVVLAALVLTSASWAGKPFEGIVKMKTVEHIKMPMMGEQTKEKTEISYYKPGKIKIVEQPDNRVTIIRADKQLVWTIDLNNKTYTEMTFKQVAEMQKQAQARLQQARSQMAQQLANLPPEQRQMVEQMMQSQMGQVAKGFVEGKIRLTWKKTGETDEILGYKCTKYEGYLNDQPFMEAWVTDKFELGDNFIALLRAHGMLPESGEGEIQPLPGFPLKTIMTMNFGMGSTREESVAVEIQKKKVPDSEFELPPGLTKTEMPLQMH